LASSLAARLTGPTEEAMTTFYLWCQAWPWFLPSFPFFKQLEDLEGSALNQALELLAREWDRENPGKHTEERDAQKRRRIAQERGLAPSPGPMRARPTPRRNEKPRPPTFREVAPLAGWTVAPHGIVAGDVLRDGPRPSRRVYCYTTDDAELADGVLESLRRRVPVLASGASFGSTRPLLRFGRDSSAEMGKAQHVEVARAFEDFAESVDGGLGWALPVAEEARRIESILTTDRLPQQGSAPKPEMGRPRSKTPQLDRQLYQAWKTGRFKTYAALAEAFRLPERDAFKACERVRKSEAR
jgi:hypothetical protein